MPRAKGREAFAETSSVSANAAGQLHVSDREGGSKNNGGERIFFFFLLLFEPDGVEEPANTNGDRKKQMKQSGHLSMKVGLGGTSILQSSCHPRLQCPPGDELTESIFQIGGKTWKTIGGAALSCVQDIQSHLSLASFRRMAHVEASYPRMDRFLLHDFGLHR